MLASSESSLAFRRGSAFVTLGAVALAALADWLFYRHAFGCTAAIFAAGLWLAIVIRPGKRSSRRAKFIASVAVLGLAFALAEEPTPLVLCVASIAIIFLAIITREGFSTSVAIWAERLAKFFLIGWLRIVPDTVYGLRWSRRHPAAGMGGPAAVLWTAGKWIIPLLLGSVFVGLFAMANPVVEDFVSRAVNWASLRLAAIPNLLDPLRLLFWVGVLAGSWALMRVRTRRSRPARPTNFPSRTAPPPLPAGQTMPPPIYQSPAARIVIPVDRHGLVERCLIVFNIIFAIESALDVVYLFGGRHLPRGMNFKEYAHRGAYPLIATALLAAAFVLIAFRRQSSDRSWRTARLLVYAWIAQNVLLSFSAGWRLFLLVNASNLTRLRLATTIWLGLVILGLITIVWRIVSRRDNAWLLRLNIAMTAIVLYACCFTNLDGFIANYNADHCLEVSRNGDVLGLTYLRDLGIESIPALDRLSRTLDTPQRRAMAAGFANDLRGEVADDLTGWRGWTWRRWRLRPGADFRRWQAPPSAPAPASTPAATGRWSNGRRADPLTRQSDLLSRRMVNSPSRF